MSVFGYDNKVMGIFSKVMDTVILCVLWLICSVPVITVGASSAAFYYAYNKCVRQERGYAWKTFFSGFRSNFKQATLLWMAFLVLLVVTFLDYQILNTYSEVFPIAKVLMGCMIAAFVYASMWGLYVFAYISRFEVDTKGIVRTTALMVLQNILWMVLLLIIFVMLAVGVFLLPVAGVVVPAIYMVAANWILERVFKKYMTAQDIAKEAAYTA